MEEKFTSEQVKEFNKQAPQTGKVYCTFCCVKMNASNRKECYVCPVCGRETEWGSQNDPTVIRDGADNTNEIKKALDVDRMVENKYGSNRE